MASRKREVISRAHTNVRRRNTVRLHKRRAEARMHLAGVLAILFVFLVVLVFIGFWQPSVRITHISISDNPSLVLQVRRAISGTYAGIVPRDSIFFFSAGDIRHVLLAKNPTIAALSIGRVGFNSISITIDPRTPLARWCGTPRSESPADTLAQDVSQNANGPCYFFDSTGFLYASGTSSVASTSVTHSTTTFASIQATGNVLRIPYPLYTPLSASSSTPLLNTVANPARLPALFDFARQLRTFGTFVTAIVIRDDEADIFLSSGTRVTYVLGSEQAAYALLFAVKNKISLSDGSLVYVDLRFPGKVYFLQRGSTK